MKKHVALIGLILLAAGLGNATTLLHSHSGFGALGGGVELPGRRLLAGTPAGVRSCWAWFPVVSLVDSLNHRLEAVIPAG